MKHLIIIISLFASQLFLGQTIKFGPEEEFEGRARVYPNVLGEFEENYIILDKSRYSKPQLLEVSLIKDYAFFYKMDKNFNEVGRIQIEFDKVLENITMFKGQLVLITSKHEKKDSIVSFFITRIDLKSMKIIEKDKEIYSLTSKSYIIKYYLYYYIESSTSNSHLSFKITNKFSSFLLNKEPKYSTLIITYDEVFDKVDQIELNQLIQNENVNFSKHTVDNNGNIWLSLTDNRNHDLMYVETKSHVLKKYHVNLVDMEPNSFLMTDFKTENKYLYLYGTYKNLNKKFYLGTLDNKKFPNHGFYMFKLDIDSKQIILNKTQEFSYDIISLEMTEKEKNKNSNDPKESLVNYYYSNSYINEKGEIIYLAEQFFKIVKGTSGEYGWSSVTHNFSNCLYLKVSSEGVITQSIIIPKKQKTKEDLNTNSGIASGYINNKMHIIFNDHIKNITSLEKGNPKNFLISGTSHSLTHVSINDQGNMTRESLSYYKSKNDMVFQPNCGSVLKEENGIMIHSSKGQKRRYCKILF